MKIHGSSPNQRHSEFKSIYSPVREKRGERGGERGERRRERRRERRERRGERRERRGERRGEREREEREGERRGEREGERRGGGERERDRRHNSSGSLSFLRERPAAAGCKSRRVNYRQVSLFFSLFLSTHLLWKSTHAHTTDSKGVRVQYSQTGSQQKGSDSCKRQRSIFQFKWRKAQKFAVRNGNAPFRHD